MSHSLRRRMPLVALTAAGLVALGAHLTATSAEFSPAPAPAPTSALSVSALPAFPVLSGACFVTGDLVGDANPADVATVLCGQS
jgi:hypothetical protein